MTDLSDDATTLLRAARRAVPSSADKARGRARLLIALASAGGVSAASAGAGAAAPGATAGVVASGSLGLAVGTALLMGAVLGVGVSVVGREFAQQAPRPSARPQVVATAPRTLPQGAERTPRAELVAPSVVAPEASPTLAEVEPSARAPRSAPPPRPVSSTEEPSIARETALLARAQQALGSGRAELALDALERYRAEFPNGALRAEAAGARVLALCALDRVEEGQRARRTFLDSYPGSPLATRIERACERSTP